jgi:hypothetical protein
MCHWSRHLSRFAVGTHVGFTRQFWGEYDLSAHSDDVEGILSVIISDWKTDGIVHEKPAQDCVPREIKEETWANSRAI